MNAKNTFDSSILEVETLNDSVDDRNSNCSTYYKAIILFLCTKLEKYVADSAKEFIFTLKSKNVTSNRLSNSLKQMIIQNELDKIQSVGLSNYCTKPNLKSRASIFSILFDDTYVIKDLEEDEFYIELSRHGTSVIDDLYKKIGCNALVSQIPNYETTSTICGIATTVSNNVADALNKIIGMRHNIIHDDSTPSITKQDINSYISISKHFVWWIDNFLSNKLRTM